jgi:iron(III) transport system substrate-binding protein
MKKVWAVIALAMISSAAFAQVPAGYPADYAQTIAAAKKEGKVVIYSALDTKAAQPLVRDFNALYPDSTTGSSRR